MFSPRTLSQHFIGRVFGRHSRAEHLLEWGTCGSANPYLSFLVHTLSPSTYIISSSTRTCVIASPVLAQRTFYYNLRKQKRCLLSILPFVDMRNAGYV